MTIAATNIKDARKNLKSLTDDVVDYNEYVIITKPKNRNVVLMSEAEFRSWQETLYILSADENCKALGRSMDQVSSGHIKTWSLKEWRQAINED
ncbi:type II toxin-antitoxin system Phd/YefM family antitoxin [Levilactobacillus tujiorum]|uniref:Antitoxin n=1 Tax=Levilactobacillus tujiorum TaxID=2912243 RepID=A0ABX1L5E9_9LACO|nr:type II toxin-antitoxin system Phd/YefM family antitoxin [Levilactobacillus tujiorum]NLR11855.1 type II toxin-antitoxin system Phd/YefM family antitoxin [Lactobacillus sp. HBUAS51387]NLR29883.1 type II toxin-antitoxin system Phd/YefM family antitoxin [Levilactobacillus tujiorum]